MKKLVILAGIGLCVGLFFGCTSPTDSSKITLEKVPLNADVYTTSAEVGTGERYHRTTYYYNGKLCRTIQHSTHYSKNHQTAIDQGFTECQVCKPNSTIEVDK